MASGQNRKSKTVGAGCNYALRAPGRPEWPKDSYCSNGNGLSRSGVVSLFTAGYIPEGSQGPPLRVAGRRGTTEWARLLAYEHIQLKLAGANGGGTVISSDEPNNLASITERSIRGLTRYWPRRPALAVSIPAASSFSTLPAQRS
jgi:hypothetical protein